jgi:hypothetical protein
VRTVRAVLADVADLDLDLESLATIGTLGEFVATHGEQPAT